VTAVMVSKIRTRLLGGCVVFAASLYIFVCVWFMMCLMCSCMFALKSLCVSGADVVDAEMLC
jgi:hypothetical protein